MKNNFFKTAFYPLFFTGICLLGVLLYDFLLPPRVPTATAAWWGPKNYCPPKGVRNFTINISDEILNDLQYRLDHHRKFTKALEGTQHQYGMNTQLLEKLVLFWRTKYNWREREKFLNSLPQFLVNVQGLDIHFIRVTPKYKKGVKVLPLLLLHGWPGSLREFYDIIPILTTPQPGKDFVFEVIAPHIPGFVFSSPAVRPGLSALEVAALMRNFMQLLGYKQYYLQGGDLGSMISHQISLMYPNEVLGFHSNLCIVYTKKSVLKLLFGSLFPSAVIRDDHYDRIYPIKALAGLAWREMGYMHLQSTKPDTVGVAVGDSPVGLAAYILEKFITATNFSYVDRLDGGLEENYSLTALLDNLMLYWVTNSVTTCFRLYAESFSSNGDLINILGIPLNVLTACARFKYDFYAPDGFLGEVYPKLLHLSDHNGGHFAAMQLPKVLAEDIFTAVAKFEDHHNKLVV